MHAQKLGFHKFVVEQKTDICVNKVFQVQEMYPNFSLLGEYVSFTCTKRTFHILVEGLCEV